MSGTTLSKITMPTREKTIMMMPMDRILLWGQIFWHSAKRRHVAASHREVTLLTSNLVSTSATKYLRHFQSTDFIGAVRGLEKAHGHYHQLNENWVFTLQWSDGTFCYLKIINFPRSIWLLFQSVMNRSDKLNSFSMVSLCLHASQILNLAPVVQKTILKHA